MAIAIVTGSGGLVGGEAVRQLAHLGLDVVGIDNDMRRELFGAEASTAWNTEILRRSVPRYRHLHADIRHFDALERLFKDSGHSITAIVHAAAQPSHDWAARDPLTDFAINANGTLNLLELTRRHAPAAAFIFVSTNKVYGDTPNRLPLIELPRRWEVEPDHPFAAGIDETMSIDMTLHSVFGASKLSADVLVQEYGRYFGLNTACFRGGCLTGPDHSGAELHGFLAYLVKCIAEGRPYTVYGYAGKQVRDNIHAADLVAAFLEFIAAPRPGAVYNIGGGRDCNCSMLDAIDLGEQATGRKLDWRYDPVHRMGDHQWWISDMGKFRADYPAWSPRYGLDQIVAEIADAATRRARA